MSNIRGFQLKVMGWIAIILPPLALIMVMAVHGLPFPQSISETAAIADRTDFLLPLCLGAFSLFSLTYCIKYSYNDKLEKTLTALMCIGFFLVAAQKCGSPYLTADRQGLFAVSQSASSSIHYVGALVGFGAMILWVTLCFTKSDRPVRFRTRQKQLRNSIYYWLGIGMAASMSIFLINLIGFFGASFPVVFVVEWVMLNFGGVACLIKGGTILQDKENDK